MRHHELDGEYREGEEAVQSNRKSTRRFSLKQKQFTAAASWVAVVGVFGVYYATHKDVQQEPSISQGAQEEVILADYNRPAVVKCQDTESVVRVNLVREKGLPKEAIVYCKPVAKTAK